MGVAPSGFEIDKDSLHGASLPSKQIYCSAAP